MHPNPESLQKGTRRSSVRQLGIGHEHCARGLQICELAALHRRRKGRIERRQQLTALTRSLPMSRSLD